MSRRVFTAKVSWNDIYDYLTSVELALSLRVDKGDKELAALVPPVKKLRMQWESMDVERRGLQTEVLRANALVSLQNQELDELTTRLHNDTLAAANQNRKAPLFTRLFPKALSQVLRMALGAQLEVSRALVHKVSLDETPAALRKAHEKPLTACIVAGEAAIKSRERARVTAQEMATQITALWTEANHVLLGVEGSLKTIASKRELGMGFVNSIFPEAPRATKRRDTSAPAPEPAGAQAAS